MEDNYALGKELGRGGFGTVWAAQNRATGEPVAIKIIERQRQLVEDFRLEPAEVEILKTVSHPNIVQLLDCLSTHHCVYLVMEVVLGGHLQARLQNQGYYDERRARMLFAQVVEAVHHLHERNIIHRDVKPENILFAERHDEVTVKLTDFGLSERRARAETPAPPRKHRTPHPHQSIPAPGTMKEGRLTTRCGTPSYCAPELLSGAGYGKAVDVWSLGVLAYVVLTGVLPFVGADRAELFRKIQKGSYDFASVRVPISALARDLIWRLLRLVPMERYSTRETLQARSR